MYCSKCGIDITNDENHRCTPLKYCNNCGKKESTNKRFYISSDIVVCDNTCYNEHTLYLNNKDLEKYPNIITKSDDIKNIFLTLLRNSDDFDESKFIKDLDSHDGYIIIYTNSDGMYWYKKIPDDINILNYVKKSEHRISIGMGCNQYIECVIYKGNII